MKKLLTLFAILAMAITVSAQAPVLGTDYEWVYVTEGMAEPTDMMTGVAQTDAEDAADDKMADGVIFGEIPAAGGTYTVLDGLWETQQMTWAQIMAAAADWENYYYPRSLAPAALSTIETRECSKRIVNGQLVILKGDAMYNVLGAEIR